LGSHEGSTCLESSLHGMRSVVQFRGGHQALVGMWQLGFLFGGLKMARGCLEAGASTVFLEGQLTQWSTLLRRINRVHGGMWTCIM
jgi:hypothetical protein